MKYLLSVTLVTWAGFAIAQVNLPILQNSGEYQTERISDYDESRVEEIFWEYDFSSGIPATWGNTNYDANDVLTSAKWEFRGPDTSPSSQVGSRGNCIETGDVGLPILSETASNGFIIFDSDYWDSPDGDCGTLGTGSAPAPHKAALTTGAIDFSTTPYIGLEINQYLKNFNSTTKVQASVNDGEWQDIFVNNFSGTNATTERDLKIRKNVSDIIGGQSSVRFRFVFEGTYYFWMIDDWKFVILEENNMELVYARHGLLNIQSANAFEDFEGLEYFQYPLSMMRPLEMVGRVENRGGLAQTSVALASLLKEDGTVINSTLATAVNMAPEDIEIFDTGEIILENEISEYEIEHIVTQTEGDESPENNTIVKNIRVTEHTLARDEGVTDSFYIPDSEFNGTQYEVGAVYVPTEENLLLHSISGAIGANSQTGSICYAALYTISIETGVILELQVTSANQMVQSFHLNDFGDEQIMVFDLDEPWALTKDVAYLAVIGTYAGPEQVTFAMSGESQPLTSWVKFSDNSVSYLNRTPMVRMNFGEVTSMEEVFPQAFEGRVFPNPVSEKLVIEYTLTGASEIIVGLFDIQGKHLENLFVGVEPSGTHQLAVDVTNMASGAYLIRINSEYGKLEESIIIE